MGLQARRVIRKARRTLDSYRSRRQEEDFVALLHSRIIAEDTLFYRDRLLDTISYYERIDPNKLSEFVDAIFGGPHEYFDYHRYRLSELYCLIHHIVENKFQDEPFTLIEVSTAGDFFARTLTASFGPQMTYVSFNYPAEAGGTGGDDLARYAALSVEADFNDLDDYSAGDDLVSLIEGRNVIVLASEIVEHLLLDVGNFVRFWTEAGSSSKRGDLIVTTPNYLADWRIAALGRGVSCQERYREPERVKQGFVHIREYAPKEMLDFVDSGGGTLCAISHGMPGGTRPQLSMEEYLAERTRLLSAHTDYLPTLLKREGLVAIYPIGNG